MKRRIFMFAISILCAAIWSLNLALDFLAGQPDDSLIVLHGFCAVVWGVSAFAWAMALRRAGRRQNGNETAGNRRDGNEGY